MCRNTLNIGWRGEVYDCDFNQMLDMQWESRSGVPPLHSQEKNRDGSSTFLWDIEPSEIENRPIMTGDHCFGCTAGAGSSCGGAILT
jgi:hypothetical protein